MHAIQHNPELRDQWMCKLTDCAAEQLIFVDESSANGHTFHRKHGWMSVGVVPHECRQLERSKR